MAVVPPHALIPNRSYSELDTEGYVCVVTGKDGQYVHAIGAMKDIRRNLTRPDLRPSIGREEVVEVAV